MKNGDIFDAGFVAVLSGFTGAKISYFLHNMDYFKPFIEHPLDNLSYLSGGLDFLGGLIAAIPCVYLYLWLKKYRPVSVGDIVAPCIAFAHFFGRLGCFMNGCCYGVRSEPLGMCFSVDSPVYHDQVATGALRGVELESLPVVPTQLIEAGLLLILVFVLYKRFFKRRFAGQILALYLMGYGILRFIVQFFRDDEDFSVGFLSVWHLVAIGVFLLGITTHFVLKKKNIPPDDYKIDISDKKDDKPEASLEITETPAVSEPVKTEEENAPD